MKTPRDHAESLLFKASHDLIAARAILAAGDAFDTVCFHAQAVDTPSSTAPTRCRDRSLPAVRRRRRCILRNTPMAIVARILGSQPNWQEETLREKN